MTAIERAYLWAAGLVGMVLIERRIIEAWLHRTEARYWARKGRP